MKKKIVTIALLFILSVICTHIIVRILYAQMMSLTIIERTDRDFVNSKNHIQYLILGDSHALNAINSELWMNSFNFSSQGENYAGTYFKLNHILNQTNKIIDTVLLPIDLHNFSFAQSKRIEPSYYWVRYINYGEWGKRRQNQFHFFNKYMQGKVFPYTENFEQLITQIYESKSPLVPKRIKKFSLHMNKESGTQLRVKNHFEKKYYVDDDLLYYFKKSLSLCQSKNIPILLIKYPLTYEYYKNALDYIDIAHFYNKIYSIAAKTPATTILDFQDDFFGKDSLFKDPNHLNKEGATIFTHMVMGRIDSLQVTSHNSVLF